MSEKLPLPAGWSYCPFGSFLTPIERRFSVVDDQEYRLCGVRWYGNGAFIRETKLGKEIKIKGKQLIKEGDVIYNKLFAWKGSFAVVQKELDGCCVSDEFPTFHIDSSVVLPQYLEYFFLTDQIRQQSADQSRGVSAASRFRLHERDFLKLEIPLPSLEDQRRIVETVASILGRADEIRLLQGQIEESVQDLILNLHMQNAGDSQILLGDILELHEERIPISAGVAYPQVGLQAYGQGMFPREPVIGGETTYKHFNYVYEDAIVLSQVKGWEGALAVCPSQLIGFFASPEYRTFRCKSGCATPEYLAFLFATPWFYNQLSIFAKGIGGRRNRIHPEQFLSLAVPIPSFEKQITLLKIFKILQVTQKIQKTTYPELEAFVPSVLNEAFRGEIQ